MDFFSGLWNWFSGSSITSSLAKTALLGYASRLINDNVNNSQIKNSQTKAPVVDKGVRLQLKSDTQNKIPVLYGEAFFGGNLTDARISADYKKMTYCLTLAEVIGPKFSTNGSASYTFIGAYLNGNKVHFKSDGVTVNYTTDAAGNQDSSMSGLIKMYLYVGSSGLQPSGASGTTPAANTIMTDWGSNFPMTDLIYAIVEVTYNKAKNVAGLPDCQFNIKNDMTLPGDVLVDYMMNTRYGAGIDSTEIDGAAMAALNTYGSTGFSYQTSSGTTQTGIIGINGLIDTNTTVLTNMEEMAKAANAWISYNIHQGQWTVVINKPASSVATLDDSNIVGEIAVSGTSLTQLNNSVDVKYQNKDIRDKTDYVKISIPSGELFANEPKSTLQLSLPFTNSQAVALRIGIQSLKQNRIDKIITFTADYSFINITAGDVISVTSSIYGYTAKPFRVITTEETEGDGGEIQVKFTCLEYDADVYASDISEYAIETDDGLFNINTIGKPPVPTITKLEKSNIPRITVTGHAPSGIVESLEYWITFDWDTPNDDDRIYEQFSTFRNKDGSLLAYDQTCTIRYSQLNAGKFYVKVRGANSIVTGPYSDPSSLVTFTPVVVSDTVSNTPTTDVNNILMQFGLLSLMTLLNDLMNGAVGIGSLFNKIFDLFADETGVDLREIQPDGSVNQNVTADCCKCRLSWDLSCTVPTDCHNSTSGGSYVDPNGPFKIKLSGGNGEYQKGTGNFVLHKSDGTVVQTVPVGSTTLSGNELTIPFTSAQPNVDYYVTWDEDIIKTSDTPTCSLAKNDSKTAWSFHTEEPEFVKTCPPPPPAPSCPPLDFMGVQTKTYDCSINTSKADIKTNVGFKFNQPVSVQKTGSVTLSGDDGSSKTYNLATQSNLFSSSGDTIWLNPTDDLTKGTTYTASFTDGSIKNSCGASVAGSGTFNTDPGPTPKNTIVGTGNKSASEDGIGINYDRSVKYGTPTSTIGIYDSTGTNLISSVPGNDGAISIKEG